MIAPPQALANLFAPWEKFYGHSGLAPTIVTFLHLAPLVVGGGLAIAMDRATLRVADDPAARSRHLAEVGLAHRSVVAALVLSLLSGLAMLAADLETFLNSWVFWAKMCLVVALVVNGLLMTRAEARMRAGTVDHWGRLRVLSVTSVVLWLATTFAGVALVNAG